jgi:hypothetical protein
MALMKKAGELNQTRVLLMSLHHIRTSSVFESGSSEARDFQCCIRHWDTVNSCVQQKLFPISYTIFSIRCCKMQLRSSSCTGL